MLYWIGLLLLGGGGIWIVVNGFSQSVMWGLGCLLIPFVALIFGVINFAENKVPLLMYVGGAILLVMGGGFSPAEMEMPADM